MAGLDLAIILALIAYSVYSCSRNKDEASNGLALCPVWYRLGFALEKH